MKRQAHVIMCRCTTRKPYGVRVEKMGNDWFRTWAFEISEKVAKNEGYMDEKLEGSFTATSEYPGCPYCKTHAFVHCGACGKITCWHDEESFCCAWCGNSGEVVEAESFSIEGNNY